VKHPVYIYKTSRETQVKLDESGGRRSKEDENYWLEGED